MEGKTIEQLMKENEEWKKSLLACQEVLNQSEKARIKEEMAAIDAEEKLKEAQKENEALKEEIIHLKAKLYDLLVK